MALENTFHFARLASRDRDTVRLRAQLEEARSRLEPAGSRLWGTFSGLFGVGTNELLVVTTNAEVTDTQDHLRGAIGQDGSIAFTQSLRLRATARPTDLAPLERPGVYVFRFQEVAPSDVDEFVALSVEAWGGFEQATDYHTRPMALFEEAAPTGEVVTTVLVTWYDNLSSWEASRRASPAVVRADHLRALDTPDVQHATQDAFTRRFALVRRAIPYATSLVR